MEEAEYKEAEKAYIDIMSKNNARIKELLQLQFTLSQQMKKKEIDKDAFKYQMFNIRGELAEIKKRNLRLQKEWIKVDLERQEKIKKKTVKELKEVFEKEGEEIEKWRLE